VFGLLKYFLAVCILFLLVSCALLGGDGTKNVPDGCFRSHYPEGPLELEVCYEKGTRVSPIRHFYPSGKLHTEVDTAGNYRQYFEDGTLAMEFTEKNGKKIGDEKIY
jgi:antitoxin component YwqK of YwqJK toxin-antitoxin module